MSATTAFDHFCDDSPSSLPDNSVFDPAGLVERCVGQVSTACTLLGLFRDRLPGTIAEISERLVTTNDVPGALTTLHNLKGNAGNLCVGRLYQAATCLENDLRKKQFSDTATRLKDLQREADRFLRSLPPDLETLMKST